MVQHYVLRNNHMMRNSVLDEVTCGKGREAVVRFAGCNFSCVHCFSFASSWPMCWHDYRRMRNYSTEEAADEINSVISGHQYNWLRITGGEPFLNMRRARELCVLLSLVERNGESFGRDVVIQTNGFILASRNRCLDILDKLADLSLDLLIEISLKGTCSDEFRLLTQLPAVGYFRQLRAVENIKDATNRTENLSYRVIMGYGPNKITENLPTHAFIHPTERFLLQMRERWDPHFLQLYEEYLEQSPAGHLGFSVACLVTQRWGIRTLRNIDGYGMLLRTKGLGTRERSQYETQWESIYPYFVGMKPEEFYALEFP